MELTTLKNTLATDKQCREYLADIRWKDGFVCPHCGNSEAWKTEDIKYKCKKCGHRISVTSGTVFQDSHIPLNKWFLGIWLVSEYGKRITADMLQKELELGSNRTALSILGKLRKASAIKTADKLANTVEVKQEFIIFHGQKFFILTAVEVIGSSIGQIRIQKADHNNKEQITEFIRNNIMPYDLVETDLSPEQKKKKVGIVTPLPIQREIEADYNRIVKSPMYTYRFTGKVRNDFTVWANNKCPKDKFEQGCKRYCMQHNGKYVHITFEKLLENLLKLKKQKRAILLSSNTAHDISLIKLLTQEFAKAKAPKKEDFSGALFNIAVVTPRHWYPSLPYRKPKRSLQAHRQTVRLCNKK